MKRKAFTLVELLVVIAIVGMLAGLLIPAVQAARARARANQCMNNSREIASALTQYSTAKDKMPYLRSAQMQTIGANAGKLNQYPIGWVPPLLSFLGRNDLFQIYQSQNGGTDSAGNLVSANYNLPLYMVRIDLLVCPADSIKAGASTNALSYAVNAGQWDTASPSSTVPLDYKENGVFFDQFGSYGGAITGSNNPNPTYPVVSTDMSYIAKHDGTSTTILFAENMDAAGPQATPTASLSGATAKTTGWQSQYGDPGIDRMGIVWFDGTPPIGLNQSSNGQSPGSITAQAIQKGDISRPSSVHPGSGFYVAFCDGHVQFISQDVQYSVYAALMTPFGAQAKDAGTTTLATFQNIAISDAQLQP